MNRPVPTFFQNWRRFALALPLAFGATQASAQLGLAGAEIVQQGAEGIPGTAHALDQFGATLAIGDFDGDGSFDLAIGAPNESIAPVANAGLVTVVPGTVTGLNGGGSQTFDLNGPAGQTAGTADRFGSALAAGDFDGDGFDDLAIGIPGRDVINSGGGLRSRSGAVLVLMGSAVGLVETGAQYLRQGADGVEGLLEEDDFFGAALVAGDFDGDGRDDLAIGVPGEDVGEVGNAGAVNVIHGSVLGLDATGAVADSIWTQGDLGTSTDESSDEFGSVLAAGDFDADGFDDLAVAAPNETWIAASQSGAVFVILGSAGGLTNVGDQLVLQPAGGSNGGAEIGDLFGSSLAAGDLDGDGVDDLAVGAPGEEYVLPPGSDAGDEIGIVTVFAGVEGLGVSNVALATFDRLADAGAAASGDRFGAAIAFAELGGGAGSELLVGVPGATVSGVDSAGEVRVYVGPGAISAAVWSQAGDVPGIVEAGDGFGEQLAVGDMDENGFDDVAFGLPFEDVGAEVDAGAVNVLYAAGLFRDSFESFGTEAWSDSVP